eukprot:6286207-Amphidinium_carterae.1
MSANSAVFVVIRREGNAQVATRAATQCNKYRHNKDSNAKCLHHERAVLHRSHYDIGTHTTRPYNRKTSELS